MAEVNRRFPKHRRLLSRREFVVAQRDGLGAGSRNFVVIVHPREGLPSRLGVVASRKTGNAVARNRGKRLVREWFRAFASDHVGVDIVVILRSGAPELEAEAAWSELDNGLRRAIKKLRRGDRQPRPPRP